LSSQVFEISRSEADRYGFCTLAALVEVSCRNFVEHVMGIWIVIILTWKEQRIRHMDYIHLDMEKTKNYAKEWSSWLL